MDIIDLVNNPGRAGACVFDVAYCAWWKPRITWPGSLFRAYKRWSSQETGVAPVMTPFGPVVAEWDAPYGGGDATISAVRRRSDTDLMGAAIKLATELNLPVLVEECSPECPFVILCPAEWARAQDAELWALANPPLHPGEGWETFLHHKNLWRRLLTPEWRAVLDARIEDMKREYRPVPAMQPQHVRVCGGSRKRRRSLAARSRG